MSNREQNIRVIADTLNNLVASVQKGDYRIPQFQREYVWEKSRVISLFDSIYREYPIGSFFLWKAGREHNRLFRHSIDLNIPRIRDDDNVSFILDGQQRITSLYVTLQGLTAQGVDFSRICFDVKEEKFTHREPDQRRYIRVCDIWGPQALEIVDEVERPYKPAYRRCFETLRTYPISIVQVSDKDLPAVCSIFQRINQAGKRLDRFDLISAMTFTPDFDLRERFRQDVIARLNETSFGEISPAVVTQLMALVKRGACTEHFEYSLTAGEIQELWPDVVNAVTLAADTLRKNMGVQTSAYLPYEALLTLLAYFFAKSQHRALSAQQLEWAKRWFWRAAFGQYYGSGGPTKMGRDKDLFDRLLAGETPAFEPPLTLTAEALVGTRMTWFGSAIRNAFLCLLAHQEPVHLINNGKLDLISGGISEFTSPEKHHIFPRAFLERNGHADVHALPNFCFLPAELNKRISDASPSAYFAVLERENPRFAEAARTHLLPLGPGSGIASDDYLQFLKARAELILQEIEALTGVSTAPRADRRLEAVRSIETRLRDRIHQQMLEAHGAGYWKTNVPEDVRVEAEKRLATELRRQPDLTAAQFADPRQKLDFCNIGDYVKIILNKANWPHLEATFRRRTDVERHLEAFSEFRNVLAHNRAMTELVRRAGELAMIWLGSVLAKEHEPPLDEEAQ